MHVVFLIWPIHLKIESYWRNWAIVSSLQVGGRMTLHYHCSMFNIKITIKNLQGSKKFKILDQLFISRLRFISLNFLNNFLLFILFFFFVYVCYCRTPIVCWNKKLQFVAWFKKSFSCKCNSNLPWCPSFFPNCLIMYVL
jgi:hypothetical protein